jgi:hypothetical protein
MDLGAFETNVKLDDITLIDDEGDVIGELVWDEEDCKYFFAPDEEWQFDRDHMSDILETMDLAEAMR